MKTVQPLSTIKQLLVPESVRDPNEVENGGDSLAALSPDLRDLIAPWLLRLERPNGFENWRDLTMEQMEDLRYALALVQEFGRGTLTALMNDRYKTIDEAVEGLVAVMRQQPSRPDDNDSGSGTGRSTNAVDPFLIPTTTAEAIAAAADGNPTRRGKEPGALQKWVRQVRDMSSEHVNRLSDLRESLEPQYRSLREDIRRLDKQLRKNNGRLGGLPFPEVVRQTGDGKNGFTAEIVLAAILNTGNDRTLFNLQNGYGWDDGHIDILRRHLSAKGWNAVQAIWDAMDSLYRDMDRTVFAVTHKHVPKQAAVAFTTGTADGGTVSVRGGYYPLVCDGRIPPRREASLAAAPSRAMAHAQRVYGTNKPRDGFAR
ncbi:MAG: hypothetical protein LIQ30_05395, partial [Planctomycetes bacterium]|nr:hypothetical protein [Planctomycetota bacterium]